MKLTFVDATTQRELLNWVTIKAEAKHCAVFRFYSLIMYGKPVENLVPKREILQLLRECQFGDSNTKEFDIAYANQLLMYQPSFVDLMQIMLAFQYSDETIILSNYTHPLAMPILDSLMKFIYERYSIQSYVVNDVMDIDELSKSDFESAEGYNNFITDIDRFKKIYYTKEQIETEVF